MEIKRVTTCCLLLACFVITETLSEPLPSSLTNKIEEKVNKLVDKVKSMSNGNKSTTSAPKSELFANASKPISPPHGWNASNTSGINQSTTTTSSLPFRISVRPFYMTTTTRSPNQTNSYTRVNNKQFYNHPVMNNAINSTTTTTRAPLSEMFANASKPLQTYGLTPRNASGGNQSTTPNAPFLTPRLPPSTTTRAPNQSLSTSVNNTVFLNRTNSTTRAPQLTSKIVANASKPLPPVYGSTPRNTSGGNQSTTPNAPFLTPRLPQSTTTRAPNQSLSTSVNNTVFMNRTNSTTRVPQLGPESVAIASKPPSISVSNGLSDPMTSREIINVTSNYSSASALPKHLVPSNMTTQAPNANQLISITAVNNTALHGHSIWNNGTNSNFTTTSDPQFGPSVNVTNASNPHLNFHAYAVQNTSGVYDETKTITIPDQVPVSSNSYSDNSDDASNYHHHDKSTNIISYKKFHYVAFEGTVAKPQSKSNFSSCFPTSRIKVELQKRSHDYDYDQMKWIESNNDHICSPGLFQYCSHPYVEYPEKVQCNTVETVVLGSCACIEVPSHRNPMVFVGNTCYLQAYSTCHIHLDNPFHSVFPDAPRLYPKCVPNSDCTPLHHVSQCICRNGYRSEPNGRCVRSKVNKSSPVLVLVFSLIISILINNFRYSLFSL